MVAASPAHPIEGCAPMLSPPREFQAPGARAPVAQSWMKTPDSEAEGEHEAMEFLQFDAKGKIEIPPMVKKQLTSNSTNTLSNLRDQISFLLDEEPNDASNEPLSPLLTVVVVRPTTEPDARMVAR